MISSPWFYLQLIFVVLCSSVSWNARAAAPIGAPSSVSTLAVSTVGAIEIQGIKRIEKDAVLGKIGTKVGQVVSPSQIQSDIRALFSMGYFDDIDVLSDVIEGGKVKLIYSVRERPVISKIEFEGNEQINTNDLKEVIKIKEWSILDVNKVREDVALIQKHYEDKGFYLAKVNYDLKSTKPDEVSLTYKVTDYDKVMVKKITFLNNKRYSDDQLKSILQETREGGELSFLGGSGNFKETAFKQDLQRLVYWYLDHGYVKFRYENPVITVSDDKKWLYVSVYLDEGEQYKIGSVDFGGDLLYPKEDLHKDLTLLSDDTFSISKRITDIQKLTEKYQDLGYAFVNVVPDMKFHDDTRTVDVQYNFEKGNLVYFGEINIVGNTKTHDKVIRRELKIHEGELFSGSKLRESQENVERLGYFAPGEVIFNKVTPKGKLDVLNIEITVKERSTGTITLGAGYGSQIGFFLTGSVSEMNFLGRGQTIGVTLQYSNNADNQSIRLGFTDPYAFDTRWSMGFDVFGETFQIPTKPTTRKLGFDTRFGYPLADYTYGFFTYKFEFMKLSAADPNFPSELLWWDKGALSSVTLSIVRDKRNNRYETTGGNYQSASVETAGLGGTKKFLKWTANNRIYWKIVGDLVFRNSTEIGQITAISDSPTPPSERFYLGGANNMKGFDTFQLGPKVMYVNSGTGAQITIPAGGSYQGYSLFELEYPLIREAGLKLVAFYDIGNSWANRPGTAEEAFTLRQDAGMGVRWFSPIGPLRFEWGWPISKRGNETSPAFVFMIGPPF